jgi:hypothetical protein
MIELAGPLPQLVVIAQPEAHLVNLFAAQAELAGAATGIADGQNPQRVPAGADRAAAVWRTVRSISEPRRISPVNGSWATSVWRVSMTWSRFIKNDDARPLLCLKGPPGNCAIGGRGAICQLKNLRAPGCLSRLEDRIRKCNGAREQFLNPERACQLAPCKAAQIHRAEGADIAT